jgi:hypothetical protein
VTRAWGVYVVAASARAALLHCDTGDNPQEEGVTVAHSQCGSIGIEPHEQ